MSNSKKISFFSLSRVFLIGLVMIPFLLFTSHGYAFQPTPGSWTLVGLANIHDIHSIAVDPNNKNILYAGSGNTGLFKSTDGGANWAAINNGIPNPTAGYWTDIVVDPSNSNTVYAVGVGTFGNVSHTGIFKSTNGGDSWVLTDNGIVDVGFGVPEDVHSLIIDPNNPNTLYAAIGNGCGSVYKTTDGAANWTRGIGLACDPIVVRLDPFNANVLYTDNDPGIAKSIDGGVTWNYISSTQIGLALALDPFNENNLYGAISGSGVYKSTDSGVNWNLSFGGLNNVYKALITDPVRPNTVYGGQDLNNTSGVYMTTDGGANWAAINNGLPNVSEVRLLVPPNDPGILYAATSLGVYAYGLPNINTPPTVDTITVSPNPVQVSNPVNASASFTDADAGDTHTASWNWGDGHTSNGTVTESNGSGTVGTDSHTYTAAGVYTVTLTVTDNHGASGTATYQYLAVYAPTSSGLFTGVRLFNNPTGATPNTTGQVKFGISVKYDTNNQPTGNVSMNFKNGNFDFTATSFDYLVTSGTKAYVKGSGTLNGVSGYTFLASGIDGHDTGGNDLIRFQIKDSSNNVVYDSQPNAGDDADPTTSLTGQVIVH